MNTNSIDPVAELKLLYLRFPVPVPKSDVEFPKRKHRVTITLATIPEDMAV